MTANIKFFTSRKDKEEEFEQKNLKTNKAGKRLR